MQFLNNLYLFLYFIAYHLPTSGVGYHRLKTAAPSETQAPLKRGCSESPLKGGSSESPLKRVSQSQLFCPFAISKFRFSSQHRVTALRGHRPFLRKREPNFGPNSEL